MTKTFQTFKEQLIEEVENDLWGTDETLKELKGLKSFEEWGDWIGATCTDEAPYRVMELIRFLDRQK